MREDLIPEASLAACRSCGAPIVWAVNTTTGRRMPVDLERVPDGNVSLELGGQADVVRARVLGPKAAEAARRELGDLRKAHHATCPDREEWTRGA